MITIDLIFVSFNRLDYTRKALASILADSSEQFNLYVWDNASKDGTQEYLKNEVKDPRIQDIILSKENIGQIAAANKIWTHSKADLLGKLDNDCLVSPGWTRILAKAHKDIERLGAIACWHYFSDDFDYERAKHKMQKFDNHQLLRHPTICGTGFLIKRDTFKKLGPIIGKATTPYWLRMAMAGYVNGFYYPLVYQEHMDDPKSKYTMLKDEKSYQAAKKVTFNINSPGQETLADRWRWRQKVLDNLLDAPWDVKYYVGWRKKWRRFKGKLAEICSLK